MAWEASESGDEIANWGKHNKRCGKPMETHGSPRKMIQEKWWNVPHLTLLYRSVAIKHMVICWNFGAADMALPPQFVCWSTTPSVSTSFGIHHEA